MDERKIVVITHTAVYQCWHYVLRKAYHVVIYGDNENIAHPYPKVTEREREREKERERDIEIIICFEFSSTQWEETM